MSASSADAAIVVAVGDELLSGFTLDTNSHWLANRLRELGWPVLRMEIVGDVTAEIDAVVRRAAGDRRCSRLLICGGLGPTPDDVTLPAVAHALEAPLEEHPDAVAHVERMVQWLFERGHIETSDVSEANRCMTRAPRGATILPNRRGMAPGVAVPLGDERWALVMAGVPQELKSVFEAAVPLLFSGRQALTTVEVAYRDRAEAEFSPSMLALSAEFPAVSVGSYPQPETRTLTLRLRGADPDAVAAAAARLRELQPGASSP